MFSTVAFNFYLSLVRAKAPGAPGLPAAPGMRYNARMIARLAILALVLLAAAPADARQCAPGSLTGKVTHVRDGDTIELGATAIRFWGIAAPERSDPGGAEATAAIKTLVLGKEVRCELTGKATYDRCVGVCYLDGLNVEAELVRMGLARDCPRYSGGRYEEIEAQAVAGGATIEQTYTLPGYCRPR